MSAGDALGLGLSYAYAFGMLLVVEAVGRRLGWRQEVTRKIIHIGAGMWVWGLVALFDHRAWGVVPFATFIVLNYLFWRKQTFSTMDSERSSPGTVYFAISITLLLLLLWRTGGGTDRVAVALAAIMAMTWGDALASLVGMRWGKRKYAFWGHTRSLEGSAAMAAGTFATVPLTLWLVPGSALSPAGLPLAWGGLVAASAAATAVATAAEAVSPAGTDNLTVPLATAAVLLLVV
jgi:phytol kinase